jgi:hypothetical protein
MAIEFEDCKELRIIFCTIVMNVYRINEVFGRDYDFGKEYYLTGVTNGELLIIYFMSYPEEEYDNLFSNFFVPNGINYKKDYLLVQEGLVYGVGNQPSSRLNQPLSSLEGINWLGSILLEDGNWVWKINQ